MNHFDHTEHEEEDIEKIDEEIDQELHRHLFKGETGKRFEKKQSTGGPLIFQPPAVKSVEEKFTIKEVKEDESSDQYYDHSFIDRLEEDLREDITAAAEYEESESSDSSDEFKEYNKPETNQERNNAAIRNSFAPAIAMLPVLLSNMDVEVDIFENFKLSRRIHSVTNTEVYLHSLEAEVLLPSDKLFVKGTLILDIDYTGAKGTEIMHSLKMEIPWRKIIPVKWILPPDSPWKRSKEYMFTTPQGLDERILREQIERLTEKIDFNVTSLRVVWNEHFVEKDRVLILGSATITLELYQKQCIQLRRMIL